MWSAADAFPRLAWRCDALSHRRVFFFNPFRGDVMRAVFAKLDESLTHHPREMRILFNFPFEIEKLSARFPWLSKCGDGKDPWSAEQWIEVYGSK
jgi:hypothetical protein